MTLEQYSYVAQIIGVVLVVASLIYVAQQLRQNTQMMRSSASAERVQRDADLSGQITNSPEFAALWLKGHAEFESLNEAERLRLMFHSRSAIVHWHNMFDMRQQGLLSDSDWTEMVWLIENVLRGRQDTLAAWEMFKDSFDSHFREFLDASLSAASSE